MPMWPCAIPSQTAMVSNSSGVPPASRTPCFTSSPRARRCMCPGTTSVQEFTMATSGFPISAWGTPMQCSSARWAVRSSDSCRSRLRNVRFSVIHDSCCCMVVRMTLKKILSGRQDKRAKGIPQLTCSVKIKRRHRRPAARAKDDDAARGGPRYRMKAEGRFAMQSCTRIRCMPSMSSGRRAGSKNCRSRVSSQVSRLPPRIRHAKSVLM